MGWGQACDSISSFTQEKEAGRHPKTTGALEWSRGPSSPRALCEASIQPGRQRERAGQPRLRVAEHAITRGKHLQLSSKARGRDFKTSG